MPKKKADNGVPVEKRIPIPPRGRWPSLTKMKVGDSFLVPTAESKAIINSIYPLAARQKVKVAVRTVDGGKRVWRTG